MQLFTHGSVLLVAEVERYPATNLHLVEEAHYGDYPILSVPHATERYGIAPEQVELDFQRFSAVLR